MMHGWDGIPLNQIEKTSHLHARHPKLQSNHAGNQGERAFRGPSASQTPQRGRSSPIPSPPLFSTPFQNVQTPQAQPPPPPPPLPSPSGGTGGATDLSPTPPSTETGDGSGPSPPCRALRAGRFWFPPISAVPPGEASCCCLPSSPSSPSQFSSEQLPSEELLLLCARFSHMKACASSFPASARSALLSWSLLWRFSRRASSRRLGGRFYLFLSPERTNARTAPGEQRQEESENTKEAIKNKTKSWSARREKTG